MQVHVEVGSLIIATLAFGGMLIAAVRAIIRHEFLILREQLDQRYARRPQKEAEAYPL